MRNKVIRRRKDRQVSGQEPTDSEAGGIIRGLVGPGATLEDAFSLLERTSAPFEVHVHPHRPLRGARFSLQPEQGSGYFDLTRIGNDLFVIVGNFAYKNPRVELVPGDGRIQFYFKLCGDLTLGVSRTEPLRINRPSLLVYNQPVGVDIREWMAPRAQERVVAITCRPEYLIQQFLTHTNTDASVRLQALASAKEGRLTYLRGPLSARMLNVASNLVNQPYRGILGLIFTEALTLELLCTAVHDFASSPEGPIEEYGEHDLKCLNAAREYLMRTFSPAPTIRQVSRSAGMSETPLKRGFKAVFGETISEFSVRCRMQYALALIRDGQLPVSRIAESVGYSHQSTFATAFRRHFGVSPSELGSVGVSASIHQDGK